MTPATSTTSNAASTPTVQTVEAILLPDGLTLRLKQKLDLPVGEVQILIQPTMNPTAMPTSASPQQDFVQVLERIHRDRREQGRPEPSDEQFLAELREWEQQRDDDAKWQTIWSQCPSP